MQPEELVWQRAVRIGPLYAATSQSAADVAAERAAGLVVGLGQAGAARLALARNAQTDAGSK